MVRYARVVRRAGMEFLHYAGRFIAAKNSIEYRNNRWVPKSNSKTTRSMTEDCIEETRMKTPT